MPAEEKLAEVHVIARLQELEATQKEREGLAQQAQRVVTELQKRTRVVSKRAGGTGLCMPSAGCTHSFKDDRDGSR